MLLLEQLRELLKVKSYQEISRYLNVSVGTVKRWIIQENVPSGYRFELMKLSNLDIDYSEYSYKEKDQFYTPPQTAEYCYSKFLNILKGYGDVSSDYIYIEPSAGNGSFFNLLPESRRIGLDIEPNGIDILKQDYLEWNPCDNNKYVVIGNPPFGLRGQLALKFINHSNKFADYVCFILPQLFESDGKGVPRKRVVGFNLVHSEKLDTHFVSPDGVLLRVECIFQVWSKHRINEAYKIVSPSSSIMKIYSLSDGETPSTTRNKKMFYNCDIYLPSTCFGKDNMKYYINFDTLPRRKGYGIVFLKNKEENLNKFKSIDWSSVAFLSTNSAYNIRSSQIINQFKNP